MFDGVFIAVATFVVSALLLMVVVGAVACEKEWLGISAGAAFFGVSFGGCWFSWERVLADRFMPEDWPASTLIFSFLLTGVTFIMALLLISIEVSVLPAGIGAVGMVVFTVSMVAFVGLVDFELRETPWYEKAKSAEVSELLDAVPEYRQKAQEIMEGSESIAVQGAAECFLRQVALSEADAIEFKTGKDVPDPLQDPEIHTPRRGKIPEGTYTLSPDCVDIPFDGVAEMRQGFAELESVAGAAGVAEKPLPAR